jgi:putative membrane protein
MQQASDEHQAGDTADPEEVFRLHALTPVALGARFVGLLAVLLLIGAAEHRGSASNGARLIQVLIIGTVILLVAGRGVISVLTTSYHLIGGELRIDSGLLSKQSKRIRLNRVQSVDVLEPLSARIFGLAEVKVTTAGSERAAVRLRYVGVVTAQELRADLLRRSAGAGPDVQEAPERILLQVPHGQLMASVLLQMVSWRLLVLLIGPVLTVVGSQNGHKVTVGLGIALFVSVAIAFALDVWRRLNTYWGFTVADSPDGLRVRHGLFSTSRQTVPPGRVQAVLVHQPLSWRLFGWAQVRMNVAGYGRADSSRRTMLIPVAEREYAERFVGWLLGGVDLHEIPLTPPPRRAALRAPLWWRFELAGADERLFVVRHGALSRTMDVVPHERTQSLRLSAGPVQRALGLATVHLDSTRGPVRTRAAHRGAADAWEILDRQIERARVARQAVCRHRWSMWYLGCVRVAEPRAAAGHGPQRLRASRSSGRWRLRTRSSMRTPTRS